MLDSDGLEERLDRELIVRLASDVLADQRRVRQGMSRIAAGSAWIESQHCGARVATVAEDVFPSAIVRRARRFRTNAGSMIEQLFNSDLLLAEITKRVGPSNELKRRIVETHLFGRQSTLALLGRNRQHGGA